MVPTAKSKSFIHHDNNQHRSQDGIHKLENNNDDNCDDIHNLQLTTLKTIYMFTLKTICINIGTVIGMVRVVANAVGEPDMICDHDHS